jgi:uncharacterized protein
MERPEAPIPPSAPAGWYSDPDGSGRRRYWDGERWTDALAPYESAGGRGDASTPTPAVPGGATSPESQRTWALAAHLSALLAVFIGLPFVGPLIVYLVKREDPYVRRHAAEALNFNLSVTIYAIVLGIVTAILIVVLIGLLLIPVLALGALAWLILVIIASVRASQGEDYRYPLTIRFFS